MPQNLNSLLNCQETSRVCLLHADEACAPAIQFATQHLYAAFKPATRHRITADRYFSFANIKELLNDYSLFGENNFIEVNYKTKPTTVQQQELVELIPHINANTALVITTEKLSATSAAWIKLCSTHGSVLGLTMADATVLVKHRLAEAQLTIKPAALDLLLDLNQANMAQLLQEINRLTFLYQPGYVVELKDIQNVDNSEYNIYQLSTEYLSGDFKQSRKILDNIYHDTADAILILWIMAEDLRKLIKLKDKLKKQININQALADLKIWGSSLNAIKNASSRLPYATLIQILSRVAALDRMAKGAEEGDVYFTLKEILTLFCQRSS